MKDKKAFNYLPRWGVLLIDVLLCTIAFWLSVWIGSAIFDYNPSDSLGKPSGNDMKEGKLTLPALYVLNAFNDESMKKLALIYMVKMYKI